MQRLLELVVSSRAGRTLVTFTDAVLTVSSFFACRWMKQWRANTYFLAPFYCFGQLIHCLEISGNNETI